MTFADLAKRAAKLAIDNSPSILTSVGVAGVITTVYLTAKASFEASDLIRLKENTDAERGVVIGNPKEVLKERIDLVWRLYIPPATMLAATLGCIVYGSRIGARRAAGVAAAYTITEKAYEEYRAKVTEKVGENKEKQIRDEIIQDRVNDTWVDDSIHIYGKPAGMSPCLDKFSGLYVWSKKEEIHEAQNHLNEKILHEGYASLSEFYELIGIYPAPRFSQEVGWNSDKMPKIRFSSALSPGEQPVLAFDYDVHPVHYYDRFH